MGRIESGQGGGWLGSYSVPIIKHLFSHEGHPDLRQGVSVNALQEAMAAQEEFDKMDELWAEMDDGFTLNGIDGYLNLSWRGNGFFSNAPLRAKVKKYLDPAKAKCAVQVGVVTRDPYAYHNLSANEAKDADQWAEWVLASSAIAVLMDTVRSDLPDGTCTDLRDGGHLYSVPWVPSFDGIDLWDVILHHPLDAAKSEVPPLGRDNVLGRKWSELRWALWVHTHQGHFEALRRVEQVVKDFGVTARLWAPSKPMGDMMSASSADRDMRIEEGLATIKRGPVLITP